MQNIFSKQLQTLRKSKGVTQDILASHLGVSAQAVSKWENGSYPDGDLIPKIADFFDVSIDYLYGRDTGKVSCEQMVVSTLNEIVCSDSGNFMKDWIEYVHKLLWAIQISSWAESKWYYDLAEITNDNNITVSTTTCNDGFTFMRLNKDFQYFTFCKRPKGGYSKFFNSTDELAEFFSLLGDKTNLKILFYIMSTNNNVLLRSTTISKKLNIPNEKITKFFDYLCSLHKTNPLCFKGLVYDENDIPETIYGLHMLKFELFIALFANADSILHSANNYNVQVNSQDKSWFNANDLNFINRSENKNDKSQK